MKHQKFERVSPESVGITSAAVEHFLDRLEGYTEMHGVMLMRHGKVFTEGWWAPYAPGIPHGLQSHSKTLCSMAIGIAITEGILSLDEKLIDIFPDKAPENPSPFLQEMTVYHMLSMTAGFDGMPKPQGDWVKSMLAMPVVHQPGTVFRYNSGLSNLMAQVIYKKTGASILEYLKPRLFDKIGINADNIRCWAMQDGLELAGGGVLATNEDNIRIMKLLLDGGCWNGERILSEEYVRLATTKRCETLGFHGETREGLDITSGYGFQMWMCRYKDAFRADGHFGIYTIACPEKDMIVSITQLDTLKVTGRTDAMDAVWELMDSAVDQPLAENYESNSALLYRLNHLCIQHPEYSPNTEYIEAMCGTKWKVIEGRFTFDDPTYSMMTGRAPAEPINEFQFRLKNATLWMDFKEGETKHTLEIPLDGSMKINIKPANDNLFTKLCCFGSWTKENALSITAKWIEGCYGFTALLTPEADKINIIVIDNSNLNEVLERRNILKATAVALN